MFVVYRMDFSGSCSIHEKYINVTMRFCWCRCCQTLLHWHELSAGKINTAMSIYRFSFAINRKCSRHLYVENTALVLLFILQKQMNFLIGDQRFVCQFYIRVCCPVSYSVLPLCNSYRRWPYAISKPNSLSRVYMRVYV